MSTINFKEEAMVDTEIKDLLRCLDIERGMLIKDIRELSVDQLDWQITDTAVTIGSTILHIAGWEYLVLNTMRLGKPSADFLESEEWAVYKAGFPRETASLVPQGYGIEFYSTHLEKTRRETKDYLLESDRNLEEAIFSFYGVEDVYDQDGKGQYKSPKASDQLKKHLSIREAFINFVGHENYHRGQITLLKYLYRNFKEQDSTKETPVAHSQQ